MKLDVKYYADYVGKKVVATTQRTASVSMIEAMEPMNPAVPTHKISPMATLQLRKKGWPVLLWIRYPLERLASAYTIFGARGFQNKEYFPGSFASFIERVLSETNPHWSPVSRLHMLGKEFLPTTIYTFEDLDRTWASEFPKYELQHLDQTPVYSLWADISEGMEHDLLKKVMNHFHDDFDLHHWANTNGPHKVAA